LTLNQGSKEKRNGLKKTYPKLQVLLLVFSIKIASSLKKFKYLKPEVFSILKIKIQNL
jgi:hypothetical protein